MGKVCESAIPNKMCAWTLWVYTACRRGPPSPPFFSFDVTAYFAHSLQQTHMGQTFGQKISSFVSHCLKKFPPRDFVLRIYTSPASTHSAVMREPLVHAQPLCVPVSFTVWCTKLLKLLVVMKYYARVYWQACLGYYCIFAARWTSGVRNATWFFQEHCVEMLARGLSSRLPWPLTRCTDAILLWVTIHAPSTS